MYDRIIKTQRVLNVAETPSHSHSVPVSHQSPHRQGSTMHSLSTAHRKMYMYATQEALKVTFINFNLA